MYIIFEGIDTCGKSTQIELFSQREKNIVKTKEPGGTKLGEKLRDILLNSNETFSFKTELLLFLADRAEHYDKVIKPNADKLILSDRGFLSGIAYALTNHKELNLDFLIELNKFALEGYLPEKIIFFKTTKELIEKRINIKEKDTIELRGIEYLLKVQENMHKILQALHVEYLCIDANANIENIYQEIKEYINR